jgi:hypothetical protein
MHKLTFSIKKYQRDHENLLIHWLQQVTSTKPQNYERRVTYKRLDYETLCEAWRNHCIRRFICLISTNISGFNKFFHFYKKKKSFKISIISEITEQFEFDNQRIYTQEAKTEEFFEEDKLYVYNDCVL